jgi:hypothetical protein
MMASVIDRNKRLSSGKEWILREIEQQAEKLGIDILEEHEYNPFLVWKVTIVPGNGEKFTLAFFNDGIDDLHERPILEENETMTRFKNFILLSLERWLRSRNEPDQQFYLYKFLSFQIYREQKLNL